jgi:hypothetical protein
MWKSNHFSLANSGILGQIDQFRLELEQDDEFGIFNASR